MTEQLTDSTRVEEPPPPTAPPRDASARNTVVLVLFTAVTNLADGVTKIALPLLATRLTSSPPRSRRCR